MSIEFEAVDQLAASIADAGGLVGLFTQHVNRELREARTPEKVRERYLEICASQRMSTSSQGTTARPKF